ncbi:hypothetical protein EZ313_11560 [Ramlibacter henchirensis]|uniref:Uncharacterized protein n=1 Tax=Ramlibacter henchirensis TaxID=204072 RepID=A0A4Z0C9Y2_9BURK|nr:hypothetical protein [Ramlibacter henchirensis]TFZ07210.1 hypothetical protein EZ313_11560 [Ramlibacter henchirensis]
MKARKGDRRLVGAGKQAAGTAVLVVALTACGGGRGADPGTPEPNGLPSVSGLASGGGNVPPPPTDPGHPKDPTHPTDPGDPGDPQPAPADFRINLTTAGDQGFAAGAALPGGGLVAVWTSTPDGAERGDVRLKRFDDQGRPASTEIIVAAQGESPDVVALAGGGFLATWTARVADDEVNGYVQRFDADGVPVGGPVRVGTASNEFVARPLAMPDGSFVLAIDTSELGGPKTGLVARFTADGSPTGTSVQLVSDVSPPVGSFDPNFVLGTVAAGWPDGRFAVAWIAGGLVTNELRLTRFDSQGQMVGTEVLASDVSLREPTLAVLGGGQLAIAWVSGVTDGPKTVFLEVFGADGASLGRQVVALNVSATTVVPRLAPLADGGFVLALKFTAYGNQTVRRSTAAGRFDATGQQSGVFEEISTVSAPTGSPVPDHDSIDVIGGGAGEYVVFHGSHSQESGWDVRGARR